MENEPRPLNEVLTEAQQTGSIPRQLTAKDLENYDEILLSAEEEAEALRLGREKKFYKLREQEKAARARELRRQLTEQWTVEKTQKWIAHRMAILFPDQAIRFEDLASPDGKLISNAGTVFNLLCHYFSNDPGFVAIAAEMGVHKPDLRKGLLLAGPIGCGKTSLMKLFQRNQRQVYYMRSAKEISYKWREAKENGGEYLESLTLAFPLPADDSQNFYQSFAGLCIDDAGTEDVVNSYGNKANVIGDIIEARYHGGTAGIFLHITTNLRAQDIKEHYGDRVASRLRETMNIIEYKGEDRRK